MLTAEMEDSCKLMVRAACDFVLLVHMNTSAGISAVFAKEVVTK